MTATIRRACTTSLLVFGMLPMLDGGTLAQSVLPAAQSAAAQEKREHKKDTK
jgi:hypothetical protein